MSTRKLPAVFLASILLAAGSISTTRGAEPPTTATSQPAYWAFSPTPPMGWNSYDTYGDSVTEAEVLANATYMRKNLKSHGWQFVVVDFRWYDPQPTGDDRLLNKTRVGAELTADTFGRLQPAVNRFPSATNGAGFKPLAEKIHAMGLKFGIHVMRGIPRQAVKANAPIEGTKFTATDAANTKSVCVWCPDMFGVDAASEAGKSWYDSIIRQYAAWGVDYIKVDDLSQPYSTAEIEAIRGSIDRSGREIVFSTSPGDTAVKQAEHVRVNANLWRISGDFWDHWGKLNHQFDLIDRWKGVAGPGHWPDADMIPFGHLCIRSKIGGPDHWTNFSRDEQVTLMTLWCLAPSPLMLGMNLPDDDDWTTELLTNDEVLAIDQDKLGAPAKRVSKNGLLEVWSKPLSDGSLAVGLFNRSAAQAKIMATWTDLNIKGARAVRFPWPHADGGVVNDSVDAIVPSHGAVLLKIAGEQRE